MLLRLGHALRVLLLSGTGSAILFSLVFVLPSYQLNARLDWVHRGEEGYQLNPIGIAWAGAVTCAYGIAAGYFLRKRAVRSSLVILASSGVAILTALYLMVAHPAFLLTALPLQLAERYTSLTRNYVPVLYRVYWEWAFWRHFPYFILVHALMVLAVLRPIVQFSSRATTSPPPRRCAD